MKDLIDMSATELEELRQAIIKEIERRIALAKREREIFRRVLSSNDINDISTGRKT